MNTNKPQNKGNATTGQGQQGGGAGKMDQSQKPHQQNPSQQKPGGAAGGAAGGRTDQTKK